MHRLLCTLLFLLPLAVGWAQPGSTLRRKMLLLGADTVYVDSLSLQPGSFIYVKAGPDTALYRLFPMEGYLIRKEGPGIPSGDSVEIQYRVFPVNFTGQVRNKERTRATPGQRGIYNPFVYTPLNNDVNLLKFDGLNKNGSISRGITMGNNQDLSVNSTLNLQLSGRLTPEIDISAAITDDNIPIQPDGNTQQLQDFDRVYIQLSNRTSKLIVGDFQVTRPESYFMNFNKRLQGGSFTTGFTKQVLREERFKPAYIKVGASAAVARGRFNRNQIQAVEGNQGPYRLQGASNEQFIVILSGSEKVYIDGKLLKRGQENDYVIDYNSAEIIFTSRNLMTKDKRIFVEFEYSDRNYARSLAYFNNEIVQDRFTTRLNVYSEQDSKNQPLQQRLDAEHKSVLREAGDSLHLALTPAIDTVAFTPDLILYTRQDSTVNGILYTDILIYSTDPDRAHYRASFTNVGARKGNYTQVNSTANGRVFRWVAPVDGVPQGNYEPKIQLIAPIQRQLVTFGTDYQAGRNLKITSEVAYSRFDQNTFSPLDQNDDQGYALRLSASDTRKFGNDSLPWQLVSTLSYEQIDIYFNPIERFRNVEFERDWNLRQVALQPASEYLPRMNLNLSKTGLGSVNYLFTMFFKGEHFQATQHSLNTDVHKRGYLFRYTGSLTRSSGIGNATSFYRHKITAGKTIGWAHLGYKDEFEHNFLRDVEQDTLRALSYRFFDREVFIGNADSSKRKFNLFYRIRTDDGIRDRQLKQYAWAENYGFSLDLSTRENIQFRSITTYRRLLIKDSLLTSQQPEQTLLNRIELSVRALKSVVNATTFYEVGSGLETRKEFSYLEVLPGQGVYQWTDYNGNGIKELNEFEQAAFPDQARYIRIFTPTQDFIRVYSNQFNQTLNLKAPQAWSNKKGFSRFAARFSTQSAFRIEARTTLTDILKAYNPFGSAMDDTSLVTFNETLRNSLFFNRNNPKFGIDLNWQQLGTKALLNNGLESRSNHFANYRLRWNPGNRFSLNAETKNGVKTSNAAFYGNRNYRIVYIEAEPRLSYQPGPAFRVTVSYKQGRKQNEETSGGERSGSQSGGVEIRYSIPDKGSLQARFNLIGLRYTGEQNNPVAFEMLEGLRAGENYTWGLSYQRTLANNMQININYDGRKSPDVQTVHVGGVQIRMFF